MRILGIAEDADDPRAAPHGTGRSPFPLPGSMSIGKADAVLGYARAGVSVEHLALLFEMSEDEVRAFLARNGRAPRAVGRRGRGIRNQDVSDPRSLTPDSCEGAAP